ncbi:MAG: Cytosol non-specific dipeptidase [Desulfovibrio sp.]
MNVEQLEPKECFTWFGEIAKIPHGSHNEKQISDFLVRFAQERNLDVSQDSLGNVCVKKPATKGMENAPAVILQGHMDMVCVSEQGKPVDFEKDGIEIVVNGDAVTANGTTLGADNGIALAYILALLDASDIPHPALEAVITAQEEVGMGGAANFDVSGLNGTCFINIDSEEEGVFCVSCAGGRRSVVTLPVLPQPVDSVPGNGKYTAYTVSISGLAGGHSGMEIDKQRGNANRLMGRILTSFVEKYDLYLADICGGSATNVIPSEASMTVFTVAGEDEIQADVAAWREIFAHELAASDGAGLAMSVKKTSGVTTVFAKEVAAKVAALLTLLPDGTIRMDLNITTQKLVESSSNIGMVRTEGGNVAVSSLTRSSVGSQKELIYSQIAQIARLVGAEIEFFGDYPAWEFNPDSKLQPVFQEAFTALFGKEAAVEGIHAGLECGLFFEKFHALGRHMDFIAFGPNISGAHTTKETVSRASVENMWKLLQEVLRRLGAAR